MYVGVIKKLSVYSLQLLKSLNIQGKTKKKHNINLGWEWYLPAESLLCSIYFSESLCKDINGLADFIVGYNQWWLQSNYIS